VDEVGERVVIEIGCPTSFAKNTIEARYVGLVEDSLNKVVSKSCDLTFAIKETPDKIQSSKDVAAPLFEDKKDSRELVEILEPQELGPILHLRTLQCLVATKWLTRQL